MAFSPPFEIWALTTHRKEEKAPANSLISKSIWQGTINGFQSSGLQERGGGVILSQRAQDGPRTDTHTPKIQTAPCSAPKHNFSHLELSQPPQYLEPGVPKHSRGTRAPWGCLPRTMSRLRLRFPQPRGSAAPVRHKTRFIGEKNYKSTFRIVLPGTRASPRVELSRTAALAAPQIPGKFQCWEGTGTPCTPSSPRVSLRGRTLPPSSWG